MSSAPERRLGYVPALHGVRAIAVLTVLAFHVDPRHFRFGYNGVSVFFVLSGFLITTLMLEEWRRTGSIHLGQFYQRRALRLLPAVTLLVLVALLPFNPGAFGTRVRAAFFTSVYLANWAEVFNWTDMRVLSHTWSLAVEEQFYLLWPPLLVALLSYKWTRTRLAAIVALGIVTAIGVRLLLVWSGSGADRLYRGLDTRADMLLVGCLAAVLYALHPEHLILRSGRARGIIALALLPVAIYEALHLSWFDLENFVIGFPVIEVLSVLLIITLVVERESVLSRVLAWPVFVWIGEVSYSLYLWHWLLLLAFYRLAMNTYLREACVVGASFLAAATSYYAIERPFLRLKRRLHGKEEKKQWSSV